MWNYTYTDELYHHGVKGMKWGVRRYQNKDGSLTNAGKKRYLKEMHKDMEKHFHSQISKEAAKVTSLGRNGYDSRGQAWNKAYRQGKVTAKDDVQIRKAAKETRDYAKEKYGESAVKALARSGTLGRAIDNFDIVGSSQAKSVASGKNVVKGILENHSVIDSGKMKMTKADERRLRLEGKDPNEYEKVSTIGGTVYRKKGDEYRNGKI